MSGQNFCNDLYFDRAISIHYKFSQWHRTQKSEKISMESFQFQCVKTSFLFIWLFLLSCSLRFSSLQYIYLAIVTVLLFLFWDLYQSFTFYIFILYSSICCFTVQYMVNGDIKLFKEIYPFLVLVNKILKMFLCLFLLQVSNNQYFYS